MTSDGRRAFFDLSGKHALVTGAIGPVQRGIAVALADAGADVSVTTASDDQAEEVQANSILNECWSFGRKGEAKRLDLSDPAAVDAAVEALESSIGPIGILVNASHHANIKPVAEASFDDWQREIARNATSVFNATHSVGRRMLERGKGRVINLVSVLADRGVPNSAIFGASQGAILGFTRSLGIEWARQGVTVNAIGLGFYEDLPGPQQDEALKAFLQRYIPLRRLGRPEDLQAAVVYLASDEAEFVESEVVVVDGAIVHHG